MERPSLAGGMTWLYLADRNCSMKRLLVLVAFTLVTSASQLLENNHESSSAAKLLKAAIENARLGLAAYDDLVANENASSEETIKIMQRSPLPRLGIRSPLPRLGERAPLPRLGQIQRNKRLPRFGLRSPALDGWNELERLEVNHDDDSRQYNFDMEYYPYEILEQKEKRLPRFGLQKRALPLPRLGQ